MAQQDLLRWEYVFEECTNTRTSCSGCGKPIVKGTTKVRAWMPSQKRGKNYHKKCYCNKIHELEHDETTTIGNSNNCKNHTIKVSHTSESVFQWLNDYGFKPQKDGEKTLYKHFENAESIGTLMKNLMAEDTICRVYKDGELVKDINKYDHSTKNVCMR